MESEYTENANKQSLFFSFKQTLFYGQLFADLPNRNPNEFSKNLAQTTANMPHLNIKPFQNNIDKTAKCKTRPQPRKRTAINHKRKCNTFLSINQTSKPKKGNTNRESRLSNKLNSVTYIAINLYYDKSL